MFRYCSFARRPPIDVTRTSRIGQLPVDWDQIVPFYRDWLARLVAGLWVRLGIEPGQVRATMPRALRGGVALALRPLESALRRLLVCRAERLARREGVPKVRLAVLKEAPHPVRGRGAQAGRGGAAEAVPSFRLLDPRKDFTARPRRKGPGPRITLLHEWRPEPKKPEPRPEDIVSGIALSRRLRAMQGALDDLDGHARRLMRHRARRALWWALPAEAQRRVRRRPLLGVRRPGRPPGWRDRRHGEAYAVLCECGHYADRATDPEEVDTS